MNTDIFNSNLPQSMLECTNYQYDSAIPIEHQNIVLVRIQKSKENPERLLDWEEGMNMLKP